ncbi:PREDICTED: cell adhesion molecule 2-like isoform X2 [Eufriesea mexicana]|uniref:cell adhesion molecule 2-like isoform X2 n=1 Tax=Eufriesea mexicana TaxID=516756 RepID=UPI00083C43A2|nr:PREDICTED: cell adhesion molecule 2-like isoform X2 [Eufriesea mexicana]
MDLTLLLIAVLLGQEATGLKLLRIKVPAYSLTGKSALLECRYDLETDKLYSITWYKDHEEFYRYVPRGEPTKHSYRVEGVKVDHRQSDQQQVLLQDVSLHSSGKYKCEVSAEAPSFNSVSAEANMEVVVLPQDGPSITGEEKVYATGDVLGLNCTSDKSRPAATLKWFINGHQVKPDTEMMFEQHGLSSVISSLRLQLEPDHIADDKINVSGGKRERRDAFRVPDDGQRAASQSTASGLGIAITTSTRRA